MKIENNTLRYIVYCRKSTDSEDRQVQSIPDQKRELEPLIKDNGLHVVKWYGESQSAKKPGRGDFNEMMSLIEQGKADAIICWKLNRLARNPIDGGKIQWLLQQGVIKSILTPSKEYLPTDNVLMMAVELGMANQFVIDLGTDVKRGMKSKAEQGWRPVRAPLGYRNDYAGEKGKKQVFTDAQRFAQVRQLWDMMLTGNYSVPDVHKFATETLRLTQPGTPKSPEHPIQLSMMYRMFTNPFYYGWYAWDSGNWVQGKHKPMVSEEEFDQIQQILGRAGRPRPKTHRFAFTGLMRCACGAMITAEEKTKYQKNGNVHHYVYYRCTKKVDPTCTEKAVEIKDFNAQIDDILEHLHISERFQTWAVRYLHELRKQEAESQEQSFAAKQKSLIGITKQLDTLLLKYISPENEQGQLISNEEYQTLKGKLSKDKAKLEADLQTQGIEMAEWVELSERTFNFARYARMWFKQGDMDTKRAIFACLGSDLVLQDQKVSLVMRKPFKLIFEGLPQAEQELERLAPLLATVNIGQLAQESKKIVVWSG